MARIILLICLISHPVFAQNYETLPKGVRMFFTRNVQSSVQSSYNKSASETPYKYEINADIASLEQIDDQDVKDVLELFSEYPEAYNLISLGSHRLEANAQVDVNAYAFAYGVTNRLTAYVGLPIFDARVKMRYTNVKNSTQEEVSDALAKEYGDNWAQTLGGIVEQVHDIDSGIIQSAFVNSLGYDELGDWQGSGLGDMEFGLFYNFYKDYDYGLYTKLGGVAPTGRVDDPDIIQDIGFGDGQWDAYFELGGAYRAAERVIINLESRYTHQFAAEKRLRVPISEDIPLSDVSANFTEKLGNRLDSLIGAELHLNDWLNINPSMIFSFTEKAQYQSDNREANRLLALNTDASSKSIRVDAKLTTANFYLQGKFPIPIQLTLSAQNMIQGRNTAKTDLVEFEFRMYF